MVGQARAWHLTEYMMDGSGGWSRQPIIVIEGQSGPFCSDHPDGYIDMLQTLHDDPTIERGSFYEKIGRFKDQLETHWET